MARMATIAAGSHTALNPPINHCTLHAAADNAAAAAALSTGAINVDAATGRWEMRDEWLAAVNEVGEG